MKLLDHHHTIATCNVLSIKEKIICNFPRSFLGATFSNVLYTQYYTYCNVHVYDFNYNIHMTFLWPTGVVMRFFMAHFGCRWSVIVGGLISAFGLAMGMVVTEMYQVYLTFGVLTGMEFSKCSLFRAIWNLSTDNGGERGKNKMGMNIFLYTVFQSIS